MIGLSDLLLEKPCQRNLRIGTKTWMNPGSLQNGAAGCSEPPESGCGGQCSNSTANLPVTFANEFESFKIFFNLGNIDRWEKGFQAMMIYFRTTRKKTPG
jgi:hypothetical protein